ncbi:hypothetical protein LguiA_004659 [Lonicera macranthoides]
MLFISLLGLIPFEIFNISTINIIALDLKYFSGHLPVNMGLWIPNLEEIYLGHNRLSGLIPSSISNVSKLTQIEMTSNSFTGFVPSTLEKAFKSFNVECEVLRDIRHRNLTKIVSSCSDPDFLALLLVYMPNRSLEKWLYPHNYCLTILKRLTIMIDVASALQYLDHGQRMPIIHCDLKPNNILLDKDMIAHVCDFGIAKL